MLKNKTIKLLIIFYVTFLSLMGVFGCSNKEKSDEQILSEIKQDYLMEFVVETQEKNVNDVIINYYIGAYNDYFVLMLSYKDDVFLNVEKIIYFDELSITYHTSNILRAWKKGAFYDLKELYESGELSMNDMKKIIEQYNRLDQGKNNLEDLNLNMEIELNIKRSYILNFCNNEVGLDDIKIEQYYGCYNDYYVVLIKELNKGDTGALKEVVIDNLTFKYPFSNREILLWKEGEFIPLDKAYKNGLIQRDDLIKIHEIFND